MNKFILAKLSSRNEFRTSIACNLLGTDIKYQNLKIDTGAVKSLIPLRTIKFSSNFNITKFNSADQFYNKCKQELLNRGNNIGYMRGVTNAKEYKEGTSPLYREDVTFECKVTDVSVGEYYISNELPMRVSCDTNGNVLLGMDILKDFDYHCGNSLVDDDENRINKGDHIFIGCLKTDMNEEYLEALKKYLGYIPDYRRINMLIRNKNIDVNSKFVRHNYNEEDV